MLCLKWKILQIDYVPFSSNHISMDIMNWTVSVILQKDQQLGIKISVQHCFTLYKQDMKIYYSTWKGPVLKTVTFDCSCW
jgi:hypothetical protein